MAHEAGHSYSFDGNSALMQLLAAMGYSGQDLYQPDFPTAYDLSAWARLRRGQGSIRDVTFVFGDLLANLSALLGGIEPGMRCVMRAFNWWLLREPRDGVCPRGNVSMLLYSALGGPPLAELLSDLEQIFGLARKDSAKAAQHMQDLERRSWNALGLT